MAEWKKKRGEKIKLGAREREKRRRADERSHEVRRGWERGEGKAK